MDPVAEADQQEAAMRDVRQTTALLANALLKGLLDAGFTKKKAEDTASEMLRDMWLHRMEQECL